MSGPESDVLHTFLEQYWKDVDADRPRSLAEYLSMFPGDEVAIAREYLALTSGEPDARATDLKAGDRFGGYVLEELLGQGGQGVVFKARDTRLERTVALKILLVAGLGDPRQLARFQREAEVTAKLDDRRICAVYQSGIERGLPYIAMQHLEGETLSSHILTAREGGSNELSTHFMLSDGDWTDAEEGPSRAVLPGRQEVDEAVAVAEGVARALHRAHEAGVIHRDIKPGNILLRPTGEPVVLDFGLAHSEADVELTHTGDIFGTLPYMSPEQILAKRIPIDHRTDIWSLGVTLYEALTLQRPFVAPTRDRMMSDILHARPAAVRSINPAVSRDLEVVVGTALEKAVSDRYATALDLADDLRRVRERVPVLASPAGPFMRLFRWSQRRPYRAAVAALTLVLLTLTPTMMWWRERSLAAVNERRHEDQRWFSDHNEVRTLIANVDALFPATPRMIEPMQAWRDRAALLLKRGDPDAAQDALGESRSREYAGDLAQLLADDGTVATRLESAQALAARSIERAAASWDEVVADVSHSDRYGNYVGLRPQVGLVPIAKNTDGLWEFWHLPTGEPPAALPATGTKLPEAGWPVILVLLPPGEFWFGAGLGVGLETKAVSRVRGVDTEVEAFFVAKHELTQTQFERMMGSNPSHYSPDHPTRGNLVSGVHPVETVLWAEAWECARRSDLRLPTEIEWEYACRGGTTSRWWWGNSLDDLATYENLRDLSYDEIVINPSPTVQHRDGFPLHGPVGSLEANGFGLHDMGGNVTEWTASVYRSDLEDVPDAPEDRVTSDHEDFRVAVRGAHFAMLDPIECESNRRHHSNPRQATLALGVRLARSVR